MTTSNANTQSLLTAAHLLVRASAPLAAAISTLGALENLPGTWVGSGFNMIALPNKQNGGIFRLKLNATAETTSFTPVGGPVPNRGFVQDDILLYGLHYFQQVSDATTHEALHVEPGLWLNVPATSDPSQPPTIVRQSTIPHGDSLLAQSIHISQSASGAPVIPNIDTKPTGPGLKTKNPGYLDPYEFGTPLPPGIPDGSLTNPNLVLQQTLSNQIQQQNLTVLNTTTIEVSTHPVGGIVNIPFVVSNANATRMHSTFWIETLAPSNDPTNAFLQLQYSQTVILNFDDIDWPHVSVATLVKQ